MPSEIDVAGAPDHTKIGENTSLTYKNVLMSNVIRDVSADETSVWIATDKGVSMLDRSTDTWRHYTKDDGLGSDNVNAVAVDVGATHASPSRINLREFRAASARKVHVHNCFPHPHPGLPPSRGKESKRLS